MNELKELQEQYQDGLLTDYEFWARILELAAKELQVLRPL